MHDDDELIISDDGSSDSTCSIIESFHDSRITLLHNNGRHGVNGNFENALQHANGEFIFLSDQDDVWLPGKMEVCKEALKKYFCVVHDAYITDGELNVTQNSFFKSFNCKAGFIHNWNSGTDTLAAPWHSTERSFLQLSPYPKIFPYGTTSGSARYVKSNMKLLLYLLNE